MNIEDRQHEFMCILADKYRQIKRLQEEKVDTEELRERICSEFRAQIGRIFAYRTRNLNKKIKTLRNSIRLIQRGRVQVGDMPTFRSYGDDNIAAVRYRQSLLINQRRRNNTRTYRRSANHSNGNSRNVGRQITTSSGSSSVSSHLTNQSNSPLEIVHTSQQH